MSLTARHTRAKAAAHEVGDRLTDREYRLSQGLPELSRLQGKACIVCGRHGHRVTLAPAGVVYTVAADDKRLCWDVRACPEHQEDAQ